jgi:hypothetical protein
MPKWSLLLLATGLAPQSCAVATIGGTRHGLRNTARRCTTLRSLDEGVPLPSTEDIDLRLDKQEETVQNEKFDFVLAALPLIPSLAAFVGYDEVRAFTTWVIVHGQSAWLAVDGGTEEVAKLQPVINGVVLPSISIALGTLSATTISSLRDRKIALREAIHQEACLLDMLLSGTLSIFDGRRREGERQSALMQLQSYCSRLITESTARIDLKSVARLGASDSEIRAFVRVIHRSPPIRDSIDITGAPLPFHEAALAGYQPATPVLRQAPHTAIGTGTGAGTALDQAVEAAERASRLETAIEPRFTDAVAFNLQLNAKELMMVRSSRLALLQTSFPTIHWVCMGLLGASIVMLFLIETDEQALQFLDLLQLRAIFTVLIGALTGIASICIDLNDPFRGSFRITQSAAQLCTPASPSAALRASEYTSVRTPVPVLRPLHPFARPAGEKGGVSPRASPLVSPDPHVRLRALCMCNV